MIDESVLERLLADEAATYVPPPGGPERVLAAAAVEKPERRTWRWATAGAAVAAGLVAVVAFAPPLTSRPESGVSAGYAPMLRDELAYNGGAGSQKDVGAETDGTAVARTGEARLETREERVGDAIRDLTRLATTHGGYVSSSVSETSGDHPSGHIVLRVPVAKFDRAMEDLAAIGTVRSATTSGEDVTAQVTDVDARLRSATDARNRLRALLARAENVSELLAVQTRIDEVQTEIEKLRAQQDALADRTSYASLSVTVSGPPDGAERGGFSGAWHDAVNGFVGGFEWLVAASGPLAFALLVGVVLFFVARRAYRTWVRGGVV